METIVSTRYTIMNNV